DGPPVEVSVELTNVQMYHPWWSPFIMLSGAIGTPIWTLCGPPSFDTRVVVDVAFTARAGECTFRHRYWYHIGHLAGLLYNRDHLIGPAIGELCDRFVSDLERDGAGNAR